MPTPALPVAPKGLTFNSDPKIPDVLPHEKMYSIQIGDKLFKLSGASLSFDSPSYFTNFFRQEGNEDKVLFIDRSPEIFQKICMHLQGYSIKLEDEYELMHLHADASYFDLPKLKDIIMKERIFVNVGGKSFKIPNDLMASDGNYPNYFTVAHGLTLRNPYTVSELRDLLRPPPMGPYCVERSADLFAELLEALRGRQLDLTCDLKREDLINECRYYRLFALEQKLIKHKITVNPFTKDEEIIINLKDVKKAGMINNSIDDDSTNKVVKYSRPYIDKNIFRTLILQIESSELSLLINRRSNFISLLVVGKTAKKLNTLFSKVSNDLMYEEIERNGEILHKLTMLIQVSQSATTLNGMEMGPRWYEKFFEPESSNSSQSPFHADNDSISSTIPATPLSKLSYVQRPFGHVDSDSQVKRAKINSTAGGGGEVIEVKLMRSQWSIGVSGMSKIWMNAVLLDGVLDPPSYNKRNGFI